MKKILLFLVLALIFSLAGCSFTTYSKEKASEITPTTSQTITINTTMKDWIKNCLEQGKTDILSFNSSETIYDVTSYFQQELSKSTKKPCYFAIFKTKDGILNMEICYDGITLDDILTSYSFEEHDECFFIIRTKSTLNEISEKISEIHGKNTDFSVCTTEIKDGNRIYYKVNIIS